MTLKSEEKDQIRALRSEGLTLREIAEKTKKNLSTVQRVCLGVKSDKEKIVTMPQEKKAPDKTEWERGFELGFERGWTRGFEQGFSWGLKKAPERPLLGRDVKRAEPEEVLVAKAKEPERPPFGRDVEKR